MKISHIIFHNQAKQKSFTWSKKIFYQNYEGKTRNPKKQWIFVVSIGCHAESVLCL